MKLLEDLQKYNYILIIILFVLVFKLFMDKQTESMTNLDNDQSEQVKKLIYETYKIDINSIKNLSEIATKLQKEGLTIPGNLTITGELKVDKNFNYLPRGMIVAWSGLTAPTGWAMCDGFNGTPDLRGRFIRMYSELRDETGWGAYIKPPNTSAKDKTIIGISRSDPRSFILSNIKIGDTAGTDYHFLNIKEMPAHSHDMESAGQHQHSFGIGGGGENTSGGRGGSEGHTCSSCSFTTYTDASGAHTHTIQSSGSGSGHNNIPPFYALAYIMKL
jgi:microcystin-dependent protein